MKKLNFYLVLVVNLFVSLGLPEISLGEQIKPDELVFRCYAKHVLTDPAQVIEFRASEFTHARPFVEKEVRLSNGNRAVFNVFFGSLEPGPATGAAVFFSVQNSSNELLLVSRHKVSLKLRDASVDVPGLAFMSCASK